MVELTTPLPGARGALRFPLRVGPLQQVLGARTAQMRAAILHHHLAIDVAGGIRNQETRKIGQFAMFAGAAERIARGPSLLAAFGPQLARSAFGRERAGRDRHQANAFGSPLHREALGHRQHRRLRHRRRHREGAAGDGRGRENAQHHALVPALDPALAGAERAIHRAVQGRRQDRIGRAERHLFGLRDEGGGGVIDQHVDRRLAPDRVHHGLDRGAIPDIAFERRDLAAELAAKFCRRLPPAIRACGRRGSIPRRVRQSAAPSPRQARSRRR